MVSHLHNFTAYAKNAQEAILGVGDARSGTLHLLAAPSSLHGLARCLRASLTINEVGRAA